MSANDLPASREVYREHLISVYASAGVDGLGGLAAHAGGFVVHSEHVGTELVACAHVGDPDEPHSEDGHKGASIADALLAALLADYDRVRGEGDA